MGTIIKTLYLWILTTIVGIAAMPIIAFHLLVSENMVREMGWTVFITADDERRMWLNWTGPIRSRWRAWRWQDLMFWRPSEFQSDQPDEEENDMRR